jgi:Ca-activated chloride channel family protein
LRFAATVAAYADALRGGTHLGDWTWNDIARSARSATGDDPDGERAEFATLVDAARSITDANATPGIARGD